MKVRAWKTVGEMHLAADDAEESQRALHSFCEYWKGAKGGFS
jgi:hypothetical protein